MPTTWVRPLFVCTLMAAAAACSESSSPTEPTPGAWPVRMSLQQHESQAVPQTDLTVTLEDVHLGTTSCVPNVPCPTFLAVVTIGVRAGVGPTSRTTFHAYDGVRPEYVRAVHHGYVVRLVKLTPAISLVPPAEPYRVDLEIGPDGAAPR